MAIFDDVKNFITGRAADLAVEALEPKRSGPFTVRVRATARNDCNFSRVYLRIMQVETVQANNVPVTSASTPSVATEAVSTTNPPNPPNPRYTDISKTEITYQNEIEVSALGTLKSGETRDWQVQVELPPDAQPTFHGRFCKNEWSLLAGLATSGNDPDSGWITITIR